MRRRLCVLTIFQQKQNTIILERGFVNQKNTLNIFDSFPAQVFTLLEKSAIFDQLGVRNRPFAEVCANLGIKTHEKLNVTLLEKNSVLHFCDFAIVQEEKKICKILIIFAIDRL